MNMTRITYAVYEMYEKVSMVFNRNYFPKMTLFEVRCSTGSHIHPKSGSIKEMARDRHIFTTHH